MTRVHPVARTVGDAARGALIGFAEIVPGVSGGTIALIVGVYDTLIDGAGHRARGVARTIGDGMRGPDGQAPFGPAQEPPAGATKADELAAFLGRSV